MIITSDVSRYIEDPGFGYEDFARRGEEHLPTFRAQVWDVCISEKLENTVILTVTCLNVNKLTSKEISRSFW